MILEEAKLFLAQGELLTPLAERVLEEASWMEWFSSLTYGEAPWDGVPHRCLWVSEENQTLVQMTFLASKVRLYSDFHQQYSATLTQSDHIAFAQEWLRAIVQ